MVLEDCLDMCGGVEGKCRCGYELLLADYETGGGFWLEVIVAVRCC